MNRAELVETLETVSRAIERNNVIPMYESFCFTGETVFAWNQSFGIVAPCKMPQPFAIEAKFLGWLKASKAEDVKFEFEDNNLLVTAGSASYNPPIKGPEDFVWQEPVMPEGGELDYEVLKGIEYCIPTTSDNLALGGYSLVHVGTVGGRLVVYSTDGDALTKYTTSVKGNIDVCLDKNFCKAATINPGKLVISPEWVCAITDDYKVYGYNLGTLAQVFKGNRGSDFNYEKTIELILDGQASEEMCKFPDGNKLQHALTQIRTVTDIETSSTSFIVDKGKLIFGAVTPFGDLFDEVELNGTHPNIEAQFQASLFQKAMEDCDEFRILPKACVFRGQQLLRLVSTSV